MFMYFYLYNTAFVLVLVGLLFRWPVVCSIGPFVRTSVYNCLWTG